MQRIIHAQDAYISELEAKIRKLRPGSTDATDVVPKMDKAVLTDVVAGTDDSVVLTPLNVSQGILMSPTAGQSFYSNPGSSQSLAHLPVYTGSGSFRSPIAGHRPPPVDPASSAADWEERFQILNAEKMNVYEELRLTQAKHSTRVAELEEQIRQLQRVLDTKETELSGTSSFHRSTDLERQQLESSLIAEITALRAANARLRQSLESVVNPSGAVDGVAEPDLATDFTSPAASPGDGAAPAADGELLGAQKEEGQSLQLRIDENLLAMNQRLLLMGEDREREFASYALRVGEARLAPHFSSAVLPFKIDETLLAENKSLRERLGEAQKFLDVARDEISRWKKDQARLEELEKENVRLRRLVSDKLDHLAGVAGDPLVVERGDDLGDVGRAKQISEVLESTFQVKTWFDGPRQQALSQVREMCSEFQAAISYLSSVVDSLKSEIVRQKEDKKRYAREVHRLRIVLGAMQSASGGGSGISSNNSVMVDRFESPRSTSQMLLMTSPSAVGGSADAYGTAPGTRWSSASGTAPGLSGSNATATKQRLVEELERLERDMAGTSGGGASSSVVGSSSTASATGGSFPGRPLLTPTSTAGSSGQRRGSQLKSPGYAGR